MLPAALQRSAIMQRDFTPIADLVREHAQARPTHPALIWRDETASYATLDAEADRVAAALQRDGFRQGEVAVICALNSIAYLGVFLGALRAGLCVAPLPVTATPEVLLGLARDSGARLLFLDKAAQALGALASGLRQVALDDSDAATPLQTWLAPAGARPAPISCTPDDAFNIIYSSGTTGKPKGITQPHRMRWGYVRDFGRTGFGPDSVLLTSTPFYSNLSLGAQFSMLALGGATVLMEKFDAREFLRLAERHRVTEAMLVPVQVQRILAIADFDHFDLRAFKTKFCAGAPFSAALKAETLRRWPGGLVEFYGMTEGGGTCCLVAHEHGDKLHTVGRPVPGHDMRIIGEDDAELPIGDTGEIVGSSGSMMAGYRNQAETSAKILWVSPEGKSFFRTGDIGRFDADGFLQIVDRKKDMIISGGFNIYPADLEAVLARHPDVLEVAVTGVASSQWGETPVAFVVPHPGRSPNPQALREWANQQLGKTQRLADLVLRADLPRNGVGKVLKAALREQYPAR